MALDLNATLDALGAALGTIPGLRVYDYPPDSIAPPAAIVYDVGGSYDHTYARGVDRGDFAVFVAVSSNSDRAARDAVSALIVTVKAAVDGTLGGVVKDAHVTGWDRRERVEVGGVVYHGALFDVEVYA